MVITSVELYVFRLFVFQGSSFERKKMVGKGSTSQRIQYPIIKEYTLNYRGLDIMI